MDNKDVKLELFTRLKRLETKTDEIYGILFGNPHKEHGIIARITNLETVVKNNSKLTWLVLATIIGLAVAVLFR